jgi:excisionase family DNA binding protein
MKTVQGSIKRDEKSMRTRKTKQVLTTGEVAKICHVAPRTVSKWFDTGKLRGYRIPGSRDRRIPMDQLISFMRVHGIPLDGLGEDIYRILIVDRNASEALVEKLEEEGRCEVWLAENGFDAGIIAQQFRPQIVILDIDNQIDEALTICQNIKANDQLQEAKVLAATEHLDEKTQARLIGSGFDDSLEKPYSVNQIMQVLEYELTV